MRTTETNVQQNRVDIGQMWSTIKWLKVFIIKCIKRLNLKNYRL